MTMDKSSKLNYKENKNSGKLRSNTATKKENINKNKKTQESEQSKATGENAVVSMQRESYKKNSLPKSRKEREENETSQQVKTSQDKKTFQVKSTNRQSDQEKFHKGKTAVGKVENGKSTVGKMENGKTQDGKAKNGKKPVIQNQINEGKKKPGQRPKKVYGEYECPHHKKCGGCQFQDLSYEEQLKMKQSQVSKLLSDFCKVYPIKGMEHPYHYRNKVHAVFGRDMRGNIISGVYKEGTHQIIPIKTCLIEDKKADEIIGTIRDMLKSFKIKTYDEDTGYGLLRYVLVKRGFTSGEIMVVLVIGSPVFPSKKNFVAALRKAHPEISTIILNINNRSDSMILGDRETVLYGKGYIEDTLCDNVFRISSKSFYQVNPVQTEHLYNLAIKAAKLTGKERVIDAYCGIGTIGLVASKRAKEVLGVEVNKEAIKDAIANAKRNGVTNEHFYCADATEFMTVMAEKGEKVDVVLMDPPRAGSTEQFIDAVESIQAKRVVYVSCNPVTLQRDIKYFRKKGYEAIEAWPVDMFPWTSHVETVVLLSHKNS